MPVTKQNKSFIQDFIAVQGVTTVIVLLMVVMSPNLNIILLRKIMFALFIFANMNFLCTYAILNTVGKNLRRSYSARSLLLSSAVSGAVTIVGSELSLQIIHIVYRDKGFMYVAKTHVLFLVSAFIIGVLFHLFFSFYRKLRERLDQKTLEIEELKHLQLQSKLAVLQAKLDPHFLFNTLNTMLDLVNTDPKKVETMIITVSDLYRSILALPETGMIALHKECDIVQHYLEIERIRMGNRLDFTISLDDAARNASIPPLTLQVLAENAVIHGLSPLKKGGKVDIRAVLHDRQIVITVEDSGAGYEKMNPNGFGLYSIKQRLQLAFGDAAKFSIMKKDTGGTIAVVEVPNDQNSDR